ncbi:PASTA domain-containing protein [Clavibacter michiganensis]|uniref:PASTA domain-containing protein n=2 Tax=Clavibacter michiganensis TaxID=28447 RepID=UPI0013663BD5|nr:PASTA domain-containing protein [Clavibacter michiganensis]MDO4018580.1 PASTA domain-containing protein [Clavibacter michiganensis]MDO4025541.1 PASTA domain-containing protein [Clavibacter michiganensis]MDO4035285.1 PASTA domain-containing protein [Clavibacter michiganensis]MDO4037868.1 PASTA domain-containing protein [Clavibacter michiganensis]MDO4040282.1 PASTA domain-containing protein [Clavibacter michiganensis]
MSSTPPPVSPTSVTPSSDEPGWFGDGEGNQRFWDGARWTSLVSSRRVFPGRASSTPEPKLISESPLPEDYAPGAAPLAPPAGSAVDASVDAGPAGAPLAPPTGAPVAPPAGAPVDPPAGLPMAPPTGAPVAPPAGLPMAPPTGAPLGAPAPRTSSVAGSFAPPRPATSAASAPTPRAAATAPALRGRSTWPWAALAVAAVIVVAAAVIAGIPGLLIALGVVALVAGLIPLIRSGAAWIPGVRTRAAGGVAAGLALVLIAGGAVASTLRTPTDEVADPDTIEISDSRPVPDATDPANPLPISADGLVEMVDVTRMTGADAGDTLAASGFGIAFAGAGGGAFVRQDVGIVASQDPAAGTRVAPGTVVTLTLATAAPERIALPVVPKAPNIPSRPGTRPGTGTFTPGTGGGGTGGGGSGDGGSGSGSDGGTGSDPAPTTDPQPTTAPVPTTDPVPVPTTDPEIPVPTDPPATTEPEVPVPTDPPATTDPVDPGPDPSPVPSDAPTPEG